MVLFILLIGVTEIQGKTFFSPLNMTYVNDITTPLEKVPIDPTEKNTHIRLRLLTTSKSLTRFLTFKSNLFYLGRRVGKK